MRFALAASVFALASGCFIYDDDRCDFGTAADERAPQAEQRNPETGQCEVQGGGYPTPDPRCDDDDEPREPQPADDSDGAQALEDWGMCYGGCEGLDEATCLDTPLCRAAYVGQCLQDVSCYAGSEGLEFYECWSVAPQNPTSTGSCGNLDAYECSRHDNCAAVHDQAQGAAGGEGGAEAPQSDLAIAIGRFTTCVPELTACDLEDPDSCGDGARCVADPECQPPPCEDEEGCPTCAGVCVPDERQLCYQAVTCDGEPPACDGGTLPGILDGCWTGECVEVAACAEGTCEGEVTCDAEAISCPLGSTPGVRDGCYTGYCIPDASCQALACAELDEPTCVERADCTAYYEGVGCECDGDECVCEDWVFASCADAEEA
jgi:hypothetical protein